MSRTSLHTHCYVVRYNIDNDDPIYFHWGILVRWLGLGHGHLVHIVGSPGAFTFATRRLHDDVAASESYSGHFHVGSTPSFGVDGLVEILGTVPIVDFGEEGWADYDCRVWTEQAVNLLQDYISEDGEPRQYNSRTRRDEFCKSSWATIEAELDEKEYRKEAYTSTQIRLERERRLRLRQARAVQQNRALPGYRLETYGLQATAEVIDQREPSGSPLDYPPPRTGAQERPFDFLDLDSLSLHPTGTSSIWLLDSTHTVPAPVPSAASPSGTLRRSDYSADVASWRELERSFQGPAAPLQSPGYEDRRRSERDDRLSVYDPRRGQLSLLDLYARRQGPPRLDPGPVASPLATPSSSALFQPHPASYPFGSSSYPQASADRRGPPRRSTLWPDTGTSSDAGGSKEQRY